VPQEFTVRPNRIKYYFLTIEYFPENLGEIVHRALPDCQIVAIDH
jgi:hypothetical protein